MTSENYNIKTEQINSDRYKIIANLISNGFFRTIHDISKEGSALNKVSSYNIERLFIGGEDHLVDSKSIKAAINIANLKSELQNVEDNDWEEYINSVYDFNTHKFKTNENPLTYIDILLCIMFIIIKGEEKIGI